RMYMAILKINLVYLLTYRANFINNIISALAWGAFQVIWIALLTGKRGTVFGWTPDDMILLTFGYFMVLGIFHFLFSRNFDMFSRIIDRGEFDAILLKPIDSQFHATMRIASYANLIRALVGLVLIIIWIVIKHYTVTPLQVILFSIYICVGVMTLYSIWLIFITTLIWYPNLSNMTDLLYTVNGLARYPGEMIRSSGKVILYILIPLALSISAPMKILLHKNALEDVVILTVSGLSLFIVSRMFWKHSLKFYKSAS
ncbi:MAG: ABC-2 family transporter protein, partial [Candidatus Roizmanbacteria bacterium]|nr:ABC-2 family transporter protein [Candidatus Roizmanbacteria bacterium]